jgi:hypothetical protein
MAARGLSDTRRGEIVALEQQAQVARLGERIGGAVDDVNPFPPKADIFNPIGQITLDAGGQFDFPSVSMRRHQSALLQRGSRLLPPVNVGLLRASARSAMLTVRTDEVLLTRAVAGVRQREVRVHQEARAHLSVNQLPRWESAGTPLKPIKNATVVIWVAEWSIGRQELMVHGIHRRRDRATQCEGFHVDQRAYLDEAHVQQKTAVAVECRQHRSRDAGDPLGVLAPLHCQMKGTGERAVAI